MQKITIKNLQKKIPIYPIRIKKSILKALKQEGQISKGQLSVSFVTDSLIRKLNSKYSKKNIPTDVLAFDMNIDKKKKELFGDIVISVDTAIRNAKVFKSTPAYELNLYAVHGVLHLLGYGDHSPKERIIMRKKEFKYVNL